MLDGIGFNNNSSAFSILKFITYLFLRKTKLRYGWNYESILAKVNSVYSPNIPDVKYIFI
jgi:hypothetical protein